jgi:tRNA pseudouridine55 synthase
MTAQGSPPESASFPASGFLNLYKPPGMTSFSVLRQARKVLPRLKVGHLGTLDPMAVGVLPLALGSATRLIEYIPDHSKTYAAVMRLGGVSDTQDAWGRITPSEREDCSREELEAAVAAFRGRITQVPPMYSAVKHQGRRLYELARQGAEVERASREAVISRLELKDFFRDETGARAAALEIDCSGGTYIRTLCHDIGTRLGTGAYMSGLTRLRWGPFEVGTSLTLDGLAGWREALIPAERILGFPCLRLPDSQAREALRGRPVRPEPGLPSYAGPVLLCDRQTRLIALAWADTAGAVRPRKVFPD